MGKQLLSIRLEDETLEKLKLIAETCHRDTAYIARKAIEEHIDREHWVINETRKRMADIDQGKASFASNEDVKTRAYQRARGEN